MTTAEVEWKIAGYFNDGCVVEGRNDVVIDGYGCGYRFDGELPKRADPDGLTTDGIGIGKWILCFGEPPFINNQILPYALCIFMLIVLCLRW